MKTLKFLIIVFVLIFCSFSLSFAKKNKTVDLIKKSAAAGMGWEAGKQVTKSTINKGKEIVNSPKGKETIKKAKDKSKELIKNAEETIKK